MRTGRGSHISHIGAETHTIPPRDEEIAGRDRMP